MLILAESGRAMTYSELEIRVEKRLGVLFPFGEIRPAIDRLIRMGRIHIDGRTVHGDTYVKLNVLDYLATLPDEKP